MVYNVALQHNVALQPGHQISGVGHPVSFLIISNFVVCAHLLWNSTYMLICRCNPYHSSPKRGGRLELLLNRSVEDKRHSMLGPVRPI